MIDRQTVKIDEIVVMIFGIYSVLGLFGLIRALDSFFTGMFNIGIVLAFLTIDLALLGNICGS